jgi:hypothetical protein
MFTCNKRGRAGSSPFHLCRLEPNDPGTAALERIRPSATCSGRASTFEFYEAQNRSAGQLDAQRTMPTPDSPAIHRHILTRYSSTTERNTGRSIRLSTPPKIPPRKADHPRPCPPRAHQRILSKTQAPSTQNFRTKTFTPKPQKYNRKLENIARYSVVAMGFAIDSFML